MMKLLFGETWTVPIGVFLVVGGGAAASGLSGWHDAGGFGILAGVLVVLTAALR
jgi:hypothetical protein